MDAMLICMTRSSFFFKFENNIFSSYCRKIWLHVILYIFAKLCAPFDTGNRRGNLRQFIGLVVWYSSADSELSDPLPPLPIDLLVLSFLQSLILYYFVSLRPVRVRIVHIWRVSSDRFHPPQDRPTVQQLTHLHPFSYQIYEYIM
jgi:hypothetical protein